MVYTNDAFLRSLNAGIIHSDNIDFSLIRKTCGRDVGLWDALARGTATLSSCAELDQYLYSYGPMTREFWDCVLPGVHLPAGSVQIMDYGCGQGLAIALLYDRFGLSLKRKIKRIALVEPSKPALVRAEAVAACYAGDIPIRAINKDLDALTAQDLAGNDAETTIHIFSNVLDIDSFDYDRLAEVIFTHKGNHLVLAVSHDRNFDGGSERVYGFEKKVRKLFGLDMTETGISRFKSPKGKSAICLQLAVEA